MHNPSSTPSGFRDLNLPAPLLAALERLGYESPSPIQAQAIPCLLEGHDLLGRAPTGTGKTAAFALPLLARLDVGLQQPQVLALTPTRELAIQVAEAFQQYASQLKGFHVLPIYGGQEYGGQIRQLKRGVHVVVGTPGRIVDHMRKGTLKLDLLQALVLDEADEMLRMGFIEEVEWILEQTPERRQMALFSATMPPEVERIARRHLHEPRQISIAARTATAESVRQRYWMVSGLHKLDALTRILEVEPFEAVLIFVRTRVATTELAERLDARGYAATALNGDMPQQQREQMIERLKRGKLDILVATDVAARGLDVDRISHVINFDIPSDAESYIHRIGRTGRAGRNGEAILFVAPRERRMLGVIESATRQKMELLELPTTEMVNNRRIAAFKQKITDTLTAGELAFMQSIVEQYRQEHDVPSVEIAAALAKMTLGDQPLLLEADPPRKPRRAADSKPQSERRESRKSRESREPREARKSREARETRSGTSPSLPAAEMERFRIEVGHAHGVKPGNIVGAIANEAGLDGRHIGAIEIDNEFSLIDLPIGMPREIFRDLKKVWVCGQQLKISRLGKSSEAASPGSTAPRRKTGQGSKLKPDNKGAKAKPGKAKPSSAKPGKPNRDKRPRPQRAGH